MKAHCLLVLLFAAVVITASGCTLPGGAPLAAGKGIVIESFVPDFSQIYSTESVQLSIKLRNAGTVDGVLKGVQITGVDWEVVGGAYGSAGTCGKIAGKMLPAVPDRGITGETRSCTIELKPKADEVPDMLSVTFYPVARVTYRYSTSTTKSITLGAREELRRIADSGGSLPADTESTTSGPLTIDIASKSPIRVSEAGIEFPIEIKVNNVGGGIPCTDCSDSEDWNKINLKIDTGGLQVTDGDCADHDIMLWRGKDNTIGCKLKATQSDLAGTVQKMVTVTAAYDYMTDATTSVTVTGQSSGSGWNGL